MRRLREPSASSVVAVLLYVVETSLAFSALALYKTADTPPGVALHKPAGIILLIAALCATVAVSGIVLTVRRARLGRRIVAVALAANLWSGGLMFITAELLIRALSVDTSTGPTFANTLLLPKSWELLASRCRSVAARAAVGRSYLVYDEQLGWTVGANRRGTDLNLNRLRERLAQRGPGARRETSENVSASETVVPADDSIYMSSTEGIRSPHTNIAFDTIPANHRIALIGDSFTFGLEVRYEDTWGSRLQARLGPTVQVLNFGVDGYGIDQAYLRYRRDARRWNPEIVILGLINDDLRRTMCVYGFLCFPGSDIPFAKPRFVVRRDSLAALNLPLPHPESIFAHQVISELPFVAYDRSFDPIEWEPPPLAFAYSIRLLLSRYRRWPVPQLSVSDSALRAVNGKLLKAFVRDVRETHSTPIVVFFPSLNDFAVARQTQTGVAQDVLRAEGIPFVDMTDCVATVGPHERFVARHYSPSANAAVARCLHAVIEALPATVWSRPPGPRHA